MLRTIAKLPVLNGRLPQDIMNAQTWQMLSGDSQTHLKTLLPPTAFTNYLESLGSDHPSIEKNMMHIDNELPADTDQQQQADAELNLGIFSDPHFLAASRTFQDHLYYGWFSAAHREKVSDFEETVRNGTLAAPWKDEVWNREHHHTIVQEEQLSPPEKRDDDVERKTSFTILCESSARAGYVSLPLHTMLLRFFSFFSLINRFFVTLQGAPHKSNSHCWLKMESFESGMLLPTNDLLPIPKQ